MIGTIRKHSKWLWFVIIAATVISFVFWGASPSRMGRGGGDYTSGDYGSIYGRKITPEAYRSARVGFDLYYWFRAGAWPEKNPELTGSEQMREVYVRLMLLQKANDLGISVGEDQLVAAANEMLRSLGRNGQAVPLGEFVKQILQPKGFTAGDFESFVREQLVIQQLQQAITMYNQAEQALAQPAVLGADGSSFTVTRTTATNNWG